MCSGVPAQNEIPTSAWPGKPWPTATSPSTASSKLPLKHSAQASLVSLLLLQEAKQMPLGSLFFPLLVYVWRGATLHILPPCFLTSFKSLFKSHFIRTSGQDGGISKYTLSLCTTKRRKIHLKTKNNQNCQKIDLYGSPTNKKLKKKHSSRLVGGV